MKRILTLLALTASAALAQSPIVSEILNNYGLTNAGTVSQGAIFIVKGTSLSDQTTDLQQVPLDTTLAGVRIALSVGGITTFAPLYYALPNQLAGILPSSTPLGTGTLVVRNNGKNSLPVPITIVKSAFGVLTVTGTGIGPARVQDANQGYQELLSTRSTNPGHFLVFYGSGLGPVTGDETVAQVQSDLTTIPISVTIGGKSAQVFYHGRTVFPGLDQINVQVPALDNYGCAIPVSITTNGVAANVTTIPVAQSGATCPVPAGTGVGPASKATQEEIDRWSAAGSFTTGAVNVGRTTLYAISDALPGVNATTTITKTDTLGASFQRVSGANLGKYLRAEGASAYAPSVGNCVVFTGLLADQLPALTYAALDAGSSINMSGPGGPVSAPRDGLVYNLRIPNPYLVAGRYTASAVGGPGVGAFSGAFDVGTEFALANPDDFKQVTRSGGLSVRWTGGDPTLPIQITGTSVPISAAGVAGTPVNFVCSANGADKAARRPINT